MFVNVALLTASIKHGKEGRKEGEWGATFAMSLSKLKLIAMGRSKNLSENRRKGGVCEDKKV